MVLHEYIKENGRSKIAKAIGTSPAYVSQLAHGHRTITAETAIAIERATKGAVRCEDLRPDVDWGVLRCPQPDSSSADAARNSGAVGLSEDEAA